MIPLSIETKLITIVFLALMNFLLLKRKRNDSDTVESYMLQGGHSQNVNSDDGKDNNDSFSVKYEYTENFLDLKNDIEELFNAPAINQLKEPENLLFVRLQTLKCKDHEPQEKKPKQILSQTNYQSTFQKLPDKSGNVSEQTESCNNPFNHIQVHETAKLTPFTPEILITPLCLPMEEEKLEQQFHDIINETNLDQKSRSKSFKISLDLKPVLISSTEPYTECKINQKKFPFEAESESDSNTRKTEINLRRKQKNECKDHCQCCKNSQTPRRTFQRCLQDLIYSTFEQMIERDTLQQNFGHKKKKKSL